MCVIAFHSIFRLHQYRYLSLFTFFFFAPFLFCSNVLADDNESTLPKNIDITLILSAPTSPSLTFVAALKKKLNALTPKLNLIYHTIAKIPNLSQNNLMMSQSDLIITVGQSAAMAVVHQSKIKTPVLLTLIPQSTYREIIKTGKPNISASFLDQPIERQLQLVSLALPNTHFLSTALPSKLAVNEPYIHQLIRNQGLTPKLDIIDNAKDMYYLFNKVSGPSTVILTMPEPSIFNKHTIPSILANAYQRGSPVIGYSQAQVKAGAYIAVYSTPTQLAHQAADIAHLFIKNKFKSLTPPEFPRYFSVAVNNNIGRSLNFPFLDQKSLEMKMRNSAKKIVTPSSNEVFVYASQNLNQSHQHILNALGNGIYEESNQQIRNTTYFSDLLYSPIGNLNVPQIVIGNKMYQSIKEKTTTPIVLAASSLPPNETNDNINLISLYIDPNEYFKYLKQIAPHITTVRGIVNPSYTNHVNHIKLAAAKNNLFFIIYSAKTLVETFRQSAELINDVQPETDAVWMTKDVTDYNDDNLVQFYVNNTWKKRAISFSSSKILTKRGILFSLYPNFKKMGEQLGRIITSMSDATSKPKHAYLKVFDTAWNQMTARQMNLSDKLNTKLSVTETYPMRMMR